LAAAAAPSGLILDYGIMADEPTLYPLHIALSKNLTIKAYTLFEVVANPDEFPDEFLRAKQYVFDHLVNGHFKPSSVEHSRSLRSLKRTAIWNPMPRSERSWSLFE